MISLLTGVEPDGTSRHPSDARGPCGDSASILATAQGCSALVLHTRDLDVEARQRQRNRRGQQRDRQDEQRIPRPPRLILFHHSRPPILRRTEGTDGPRVPCCSLPLPSPRPGPLFPATSSRTCESSSSSCSVYELSRGRPIGSLHSSDARAELGRTSEAILISVSSAPHQRPSGLHVVAQLRCDAPLDTFRTGPARSTACSSRASSPRSSPERGNGSGGRTPRDCAGHPDVMQSTLSLFMRNRGVEDEGSGRGGLASRSAR